MARPPMDEWPVDYEIDSDWVDERGNLRGGRSWAHTPGLRDAVIAVLTREHDRNIIWRERPVHPTTYAGHYTSEVLILARATPRELAHLTPAERAYLTPAQAVTR